MTRFIQMWRKAITWGCVGVALVIVGLMMVLTGMFLSVFSLGLAWSLLGFGVAVAFLGIASLLRTARMPDAPVNGLET